MTDPIINHAAYQKVVAQRAAKGDVTDRTWQRALLKLSRDPVARQEWVAAAKRPTVGDKRQLRPVAEYLPSLPCLLPGCSNEFVPRGHNHKYCCTAHAVAAADERRRLKRNGTRQ